MNKATATPVAYPLSYVESMRTEWLWRQWLPLGCITVMDGDPGVGKSTITTHIAARLTSGKSLPPFHAGPELEPTHVVVLSAEDDVSRTIRPRMELAGKDLERVIILEAIRRDEEDPVTLPCDLKHLETVVVEHQAKLVIIDPFNAYLDESVNTYKDHDVRRCLRQLHKLAERHQLSVLIVRHLNKAMGMSAKHRGGGSMGIIGAARAAWMVGTDPNDKDTHVLAVSKSNLAPKPDSLGYRIDTVDDVGVVEWLGESHLDADAIVASPQGQGQAKESLTEMMTRKGGEVKVRDVQRASRRWSTAEAAEAALADLVQIGLARWVDRPATGKGGRPTRVYQLLTHVDADTTG